LSMKGGVDGHTKENQQFLGQLSHYEAQHIEELVAKDVRAFATKCIAGFSPEKLTSTQFDAMVSLGKDFYNNALCKYLQNSSLGDKFSQHNRMSNAVPSSHADSNGWGPESPAPPESPDPLKSSKAAPSSKAPLAATEPSITLRELKPKLEKAVAETLHSYGIHGDGLIDTRKMARMHKLQTMLHA
jgi:hypothetical protein